MFEHIVSHFNESTDAITQSSEALIPYIAESTNLCVSRLSNAKAFILTDEYSHAASTEFNQRLLHLNQNQRPSLPCLLLDSRISLAEKQFTALNQSNDLLIIFALHPDTATTIAHHFKHAQTQSLVIAPQPIISLLKAEKNLSISSFIPINEMKLKDQKLLQLSVAQLLADLIELSLFNATFN